MPNVFRLAYVDLATPSLDDARHYYETVLGLQPVESSGASAYLSLGLDHHNLALHQAGREGLGAIGLQVSAGVPLPDLARKLQDLGFQSELKSDARPGVSSLLSVEAGGHQFEIIADMASPAPGFPHAGVSPLRLGHVAVLSPDPARLLQFLNEGLGFFTTDWFDQLVTFVTCNQDHHVMNIAAAPFATLHHLAFQLGGADHQVRAADLLTRHKVPTLWGPARHTAGHNIASYHHGADKALIELYNDMDVFVPDLGYCEPRPWHGDLPQRPKHWSLTDMSRWDTRYEFSLAAIQFGLPSA
jgi:catechol 2,3-dioxygenase-like lactoylglutathione lyase family enzyme